MGLAEDIARLELNLRELIIKYEQYFLGIEKREPLKLLEEVERGARLYQNTSISNTMLRFKYNSLVAALNVQKQKWSRINRLIEEGKYHRERFKMAIHQEKPISAPAKELPEESYLERLYQEYLSARRACNLPVHGVSREKIASAIERQRPAIVNAHRFCEVEYVVVIEEGKPRIKARPKRP